MKAIVKPLCSNVVALATHTLRAGPTQATIDSVPPPGPVRGWLVATWHTDPETGRLECRWVSGQQVVGHVGTADVLTRGAWARCGKKVEAR